MSYVIRVITIDGAHRDFAIRDADKAYSYYNSRSQRTAADGTVEVTEWKIMNATYSFKGQDFDTFDEASKAKDAWIAEQLQLLSEEKIEETLEDSGYHPIEFPDKDWIANPDKDTVVKSDSEIQQEIYEAQQKKLDDNAAIDGNPAARSFSSASPK